MDCRVVVEAAVPVYDVETADEAVRIAISKTGEMLNPELNYVEIDMNERSCPHCGEALDPAFIAADEGLVALELEMTVFNVERDEHAARIAPKEIGQRLENIPLRVLEIEEVGSESADGEKAEEGDADDEGDDDETEPDPAEELASLSAPGEDEVDDTDASGEGSEDGTDEDDVLPEFEELIED
jgi:uncharacterized protein (UPF0212 family)